MRAFGPFPTAGPHKQFTVFLAFVAMKFVDRHGFIVAENAASSSPSGLRVNPKAEIRRPKGICLLEFNRRWLTWRLE
jgi:hypothetical protein